MPGLFDTLRGLRRPRPSPFDRDLAGLTRDYFQSGDRLSDLPQPQKDRIIAEMAARVAHVRGAADPRRELRAVLTDTVLAFTELAVLALHEDERATVAYGRNPNISGALHPYIAQAADHSEELTRARQAEGLSTPEELVAWCNRRGLVMLYLANGLSLLRSETQDVPAGADWFIPLVEAIAVVREYGYREALGLPQLIADPHDAAAYRAFMDLVLAGEPDPVAAWSARHPHQPLGS